MGWHRRKFVDVWPDGRVEKTEEFCYFSRGEARRHWIDEHVYYCECDKKPCPRLISDPGSSGRWGF